MTTIQDVLNSAIPAATSAILNNSGIDLARQLKDEGHYDVVAVIGFSGEGFAGALGFATERSLIEAAYGECDTLLADSWLGEVANQLLGRTKNAFLAYGIEIRLAIPMVLHGLKIQARIAETNGSQFQFTSASGRACVWVDANWNTRQKVQPADTEQHAKAEGDIVIF